MTSLGLANDLGGPDLNTEVLTNDFNNNESTYKVTSHLVQVVHHPSLYHGQAELVVARAGSEPHGEADGL